MLPTSGVWIFHNAEGNIGIIACCHATDPGSLQKSGSSAVPVGSFLSNWQIARTLTLNPKSQGYFNSPSNLFSIEGDRNLFHHSHHSRL